MSRSGHPIVSILAGLAVVMGTSNILATPSPNKGNVLQRIDVQEARHKTIVSIDAKARPTFTVFKLADPPRLFVDIMGADVSSLKPTMNVANGVVERITSLQYMSDMGPVGRIVVEFRQEAAYDIKTQGNTIQLMVDGSRRNRPDLRLKAAELEAHRLEQAIARETKLLSELERSRKRAEELVKETHVARQREEEIVKKVEQARKDAQRLSKLAQEEAQSLTDKLEALRQAEVLGQAKVGSLKKAAIAEAARKKAVELEFLRTDEHKKATQEALLHERARLAAMKVATKRAEEERTAAELAAKAAEARRQAAERVAEAKSKGLRKDMKRLKKMLTARDKELKAANSTVKRQQEAVEEAELAQAQAEARLRETNQRKLELEGARRKAAEESLAQERKRTQALEIALERTKGLSAKRNKRLAKDSEQAQEKLAKLEVSLAKQRFQVQDAHKQSETEKARATLLDDELETQHGAIASLKQARAADKAKVANLKDQLERLKAERVSPAKGKGLAKAEKAKKAKKDKKAKKRRAPRPVITDVSFQGSKGMGQVKIQFTKRPTYEIVQRSSKRLELRLESTVIPRKLERILDATDFQGPVKSVSTFRSAERPGVVRVVVDLASTVLNDIKVKGKSLLWSFERAHSADESEKRAKSHAKAPQQVPPPRMPPGVHAYPGYAAAEGGAAIGKAGTVTRPIMRKRNKRRKRKYSGKKINLTIKDADIQHVLTFLAKEGSVNIVASDDVKGKVTFHLENIPWDLALDMILKTQGYDYVKEHGVYRVAPAEDIQKEFEQELKRKQTIDELKPLVVRFVTVNYASLEDIADHIKTVLTKNGTVAADTSTSTLIIKDVEEHVGAAEDIVRRLDVQLPQVLIEARIVEASISFSREVGIQWGGNFTMSPAFGNQTGLVFPSVVGVSGGADDATAPGSGLLASSPNFAVNLPAAAGAGAGGALGLTLGSLGGAANINLRLSAAEDAGEVKIISAPKILTIDGKKASIRQGVSIPISVVSANGVNTQFFNADLKLEVMTSTSPDGNIRLDIDIAKNEPDFGQTAANGAPTIQKKEAHTSLLVRDGDTTVIGGVYTRNTGHSNAMVPFLSKVPILGWFFQNHRESDSRSELLIFITPRIANRRASLVDSGPG